MADTEYTRGSMDISEQRAAWRGFLAASTWGGLITTLLVGYLTLTLATGMNWLVALAICAIVGLIAGAVLGMGGAWIATVGGLVGLAFIVQMIITLFGAVI